MIEAPPVPTHLVCAAHGEYPLHINLVLPQTSGFWVHTTPNSSNRCCGVFSLSYQNLQVPSFSTMIFLKCFLSLKCPNS